jgi:Tfp pilus assembly protein PilV
MRIYNMPLKKQICQCAGEKGFSLVEVIVIILILSIAIIPLSRLAIGNIDAGRTYSLISRGTLYAQEIMERIIADYVAELEDSQGYDWVKSNWPGTVSGSPTGFTGNVDISSETTVNSVTYVTVTVTVSANDMPDIVLSTWLVDHVFE